MGKPVSSMTANQDGTTRFIVTPSLQASVDRFNHTASIAGTDGSVTVHDGKIDIYRFGKGFQHLSDPKLAHAIESALTCIFADGKITSDEFATLNTFSSNPALARNYVCKAATR